MRFAKVIAKKNKMGEVFYLHGGLSWLFTVFC